MPASPRRQFLAAKKLIFDEAPRKILLVNRGRNARCPRISLRIRLGLLLSGYFFVAKNVVESFPFFLESLLRIWSTLRNIWREFYAYNRCNSTALALKKKFVFFMQRGIQVFCKSYISELLWLIAGMLWILYFNNSNLITFFPHFFFYFNWCAVIPGLSSQNHSIH